MTSMMSFRAKILQERKKIIKVNHKRIIKKIMWEREPALQAVIANAWQEAGEKNSLGDVHAALRGTMRKPCGWSKENFGNVAKEIETSRTQLEELMLMNADRCEIRRVTDRMNELLYREELM